MSLNDAGAGSPARYPEHDSSLIKEKRKRNFPQGGFISLWKRGCPISVAGSLIQLWFCFRLNFTKVPKTQKCKLRWRPHAPAWSPHPCSFLLYTTVCDDEQMTDIISRLSWRISSCNLLGRVFFLSWGLWLPTNSLSHS